MENAGENVNYFRKKIIEKRGKVIIKKIKH